MNSESYNTVLLIAGALITALMFINYKQGTHLRDMLPPSFTPLVPVLLNTLTDLAKVSPNPLDDELVEKLRELLDEQKPTGAG